ncbi:MAG: hypothetical protein QW435_03365 [Candidatus Hadarchaeales archaeon]
MEEATMEEHGGEKSIKFLALGYQKGFHSVFVHDFFEGSRKVRPKEDPEVQDYEEGGKDGSTAGRVFILKGEHSFRKLVFRVFLSIGIENFY